MSSEILRRWLQPFGPPGEAVIISLLLPSCSKDGRKDGDGTGGLGCSAGLRSISPLKTVWLTEIGWPWNQRRSRLLPPLPLFLTLGSAFHVCCEKPEKKIRAHLLLKYLICPWTAPVTPGGKVPIYREGN